MRRIFGLDKEFWADSCCIEPKIAAQFAANFIKWIGLIFYRLRMF